MGREFFRKRIGIEVEKWPSFEEVLEEAAANGTGANTLANITVTGLSKQDDALLVGAHAGAEGNRSEPAGLDEQDESSESGGSEDEEDGEQQVEDENPSEDKSFEGLVPAEGAEALRDEEDSQAVPEDDGNGASKGGYDAAEAPVATAPDGASKGPE